MKKIILTLLLIISFPVLAVPPEILGVGTDTLEVWAESGDAIILYDVAGGTGFDATYTNPYYLHDYDFGGYTGIIAFGAPSGTYLACYNETPADCISNGDGYVIGDIEGYFVSSGVWHEFNTDPVDGGVSDQYTLTDKLFADFWFPLLVSIFFTSMLIGIGFGFIKREFKN